MKAHLTNTPRGYYDGYMIKDIKHRALHRSKILQGQMKGLEKMIEKDEYCMDIITQSLAIQKSLSSLNKLMVENHLKTHITQGMTSNDEEKQSKAVEEMVSLYELTQIRGK